jgi:hypothetical protein
MRLLTFLSLFSALAAHAQNVAKWRLVEDWRKGAEIDGPYAFDGVLKHSWTALASAPGSRIAWMDTENSRIHVYDSAGTVVRSIGRAGSGPGEFRSPMGFAIARDGRIAVFDQRNGRYVLFAPNGDFDRVSAIVRRSPFSFNITWDGSFDASGRLLQSVAIPPRKPATVTPTGATFGDSVLMTERMSADLTRSDSVALCGSPPPIATHVTRYYLRTFRPVVIREAGSGAAPPPPPTGSVATIEVPFTEMRNEFVRDRDGFEWAPSAVGSPELVRRESGRCATVLARVMLRGPRAPIPAIKRDSEFTRVPAEVRQFVPKEFPWFRALRVDDQNRLWVQRDVIGGMRFDVYTSGGQLAAEVDLPAAIDTALPIAIAHNRVYGFVKSADDVPYLVAWRIITR